MDVEALVDRLQGDLFVPLLLGLTAAFAYLTILARAHLQTRVLSALARQCGRRCAEEEERERRIGYSPDLARFRRLHAALARRLER